MNIWEILLKFVAPPLLLIGVGFAQTIINKKKNSSDDIKAELKAWMESKCSECGFKQTAITESKVNRQMTVAKGYLDLIWRDMKISYQKLIQENYHIDIISEKESDERKSFFVSTYETKIPLMDKYEAEFRKNGIEDWNVYDIESRANRMFAFLAEEFENNFNPIKKEISTLVMNELENKKSTYIGELIKLYNSAKDVYKEKDDKE